MNLEYFISRHIYKAQEDGEGKFSKPVIKIAVLAISLSLIVMIIAVSILTGFQKEIRDKVIGFGSHIQISNFDSNNSLEPAPVKRDLPFVNNIKQMPNVKHVQVFATKAGIMKGKNDIEGVVLKGVDPGFDWSFFKNKMIEGKVMEIKNDSSTNDIIVSKQIAAKLSLKVNDQVVMYFIQQPPRARKFRITGIYYSGLEEFDTKFVIGDIRHIQKLNDWDSSMVAGYEVQLKDFNKLDETGNQIYSSIGIDLDSRTIEENYPQIFDWLNLTNMNVKVILILMIIVGVINMVTALLILILERTIMIGILKALGANNWSVRKIFLYNSFFLIGKGLFWGNVVGISLCLIQKYTGIISLDPESYYVTSVPINLDAAYILALNLGTLAVCLCVLVIPSYVVTKISPVKAMRFS